MKGKFPASFETYQVVESGDLVLCMFDVEETPRTVGLSRHHGMITGAYDVYRSDDSLALEYLTRLLLVLDENKALAPLYRGLRKTIPRSAFESLKVPMPSKDEQGLIVRYLDHAELRIAKAIAAKQALMNRLLELRHVQIAEGILGADGTRLLNSSLPYNVPESWCVEPFWSVAPEVSISDQQGKELLSVYLNRGVIRYSESAGQVHKPSLDLSGYQLVRPGDLVMNNQQAWRGSVGVSRYEGIVSPAYVVCSLEDRFDLEYANMLFRSPAMVSQFEMASRGVGSIQRQLHRQTLRVTKVPIPPLEEQVQIATRLVAATKGLDRAIQSLENEIALLKEYRTRLISDVVTGKLDVRTEAAKLPEIDPMELATVAVGENGDDEEATDDD
jgi:type I restriction enzyme S subunit